MSIKEQSEVFLENLKTRKRSPGKPTTLAAYHSFIQKWILPELGDLDLAVVENGTAKRFVTKLSNEGLAASSVTSILTVLKGIVKSAIDENGNCLYPRVWNNNFIDLPEIDQKDQKAPIISPLQVARAIKSSSLRFRSLYALLAGSGLRIAESMALKQGSDDKIGSFWLPGESKLVIRGQMYQNTYQAPKTAAGNREVDLAPELNLYLIENMPKEEGFCFPSMPDMFRRARKDKVPGFHSLRRFRVTHLRSRQIPEDIIKYWIGHGNKTITDRYSKMHLDTEARKEWAIKAGLGFEIPKEA